MISCGPFKLLQFCDAANFGQFKCPHDLEGTNQPTGNTSIPMLPYSVLTLKSVNKDPVNDY